MDLRINSHACTYMMNAQSIGQIKDMFAKLHAHIPELKLVASASLEKYAKFNDFTDALVVLEDHEHSRVVIGAPLRNNEVIFWSPTVQSPGIYACCGDLEL